MMPGLSITLMLPGETGTPGETFERQVVCHTIGELESALGGRAYLWGWCTPMLDATRQAMPLSELDAFSTADRYGFSIVEVTPDKQWWRSKAIDSGRVGL